MTKPVTVKKPRQKAKPKPRQHNEYFRPVKTRSIYTMKTRPPELVEEILSRPENTLSREFLQTPYRSFVGRESAVKKCPCCKQKLEPGEFVWSWGEYLYGKWRTVKHFCKACFPMEVKQPLASHPAECEVRDGTACEIVPNFRDAEQPEWFTL